VISSYFKSFHIFSDAEIENITCFFKEKKMKKNDFFIKEGDTGKQVAFIASGIFRSYYISEDGKDNTYCFRFPNEFLASYASFITDKPGMENMQAVSDAVIFVIPKSRIEELANENQRWTLFLKRIAEQEYLEIEKRFFQLQRESAAQRYTFLLQHQPHYIQQIPLQYLASYLGITQRHLSRIRKEISF